MYKVGGYDHNMKLSFDDSKKNLRKQRSLSANDADWELIKETAKESGADNVSQFLVTLVKEYRKQLDN